MKIEKKSNDDLGETRTDSFCENKTMATASGTVKKVSKPQTLLNTNSSILAIEDSNDEKPSEQTKPMQNDRALFDQSALNGSMIETRSKGMVNSDDDGFYNNSPFHQKMSSPAGYHQSLDQYFLGGINSSKNHLRTLKTITDNRPMRNKVHQSLMAPTATSLNNAMKVFRKQQAVLQVNAKAVMEKATTPADALQRRIKATTGIYAVHNPRTNQTARRKSNQ